MKIGGGYTYLNYMTKFTDEIKNEHYSPSDIFMCALTQACRELVERDSRIRELEAKVSEMNDYQKGNWFTS